MCNYWILFDVHLLVDVLVEIFGVCVYLISNHVRSEVKVFHVNV